MARKISNRPVTIKVQGGDLLPGLGLHMGAGDGNRTHIISLGSGLITLGQASELHVVATWNVRDGPLVTLANCTVIFS
jgi:hypothetical protein